MSTLRGPIVSAATALVILGASLLLLLTPFYTHAALDAAGSAAILGTDPATTHQLSDRTILELFIGPGTFGTEDCGTRRLGFGIERVFTCFYDAAEAGHLRDVQVVLYGFLGVVLLAAAFLLARAKTARRATWFWEAIARGGASLAVALAVVGGFFLVAFETAFELFHRIFFPGGNWAFDPGSQRLVQLYPTAFWQLTSAALGVLAIGGGALTWWLARRRARTTTRREASRHAVAARSIGPVEVAR